VVARHCGLLRYRRRQRAIERPQDRLVQLHQIEKDGAAAASVNRLRASLHSIFAHAIDAKKWTGANPVAGVKTRPVPKRACHLLRAEEVPTVLEAAGDTWRDLCAAAIYLGLRKGELFALTKQDVDFADREITIGRSHASDTTKGRKAVVLPIPKPLQPFLEHAIQSAQGQFVFPRADGTQRPENTAMEGLAPHPGARERHRRVPPHVPALCGAKATRYARVPRRRTAAVPDLQHAHVAERDPAPDALPQNHLS
jgi:integrase